MAQKFVPMAFIDNSEIKIADDNGVEYIPLLEAQKARLIKKDKLFKFYAIPALISLACAVSPLFIDHFNQQHTIFFAVVTVVLVLGMLFNRMNRSELYDMIASNTAEFNRAKKILQPEIMEMEKELARHTGSLQEISLQSKFNFKKPQEMMA
jgi:hypothetical protein